MFNKLLALILLTYFLVQEAIASDELIAPLPCGRIDNISVTRGDYLNLGDHVRDLICMKMRVAVVSKQNGYVENVLVHPGQVINAPQTILLRFTQAPKISQLIEHILTKAD